VGGRFGGKGERGVVGCAEVREEGGASGGGKKEV